MHTQTQRHTERERGKNTLTKKRKNTRQVDDVVAGFV